MPSGARARSVRRKRVEDEGPEADHLRARAAIGPYRGEYGRGLGGGERGRLRGRLERREDGRGDGGDPVRDPFASVEHRGVAEEGRERSGERSKFPVTPAPARAARNVICPLANRRLEGRSLPSSGRC